MTDEPSPDVIDPLRKPFAALAGANRRNLIACPLCGKPGTPTPLPSFPRAFFFRDELSMREYQISALCQSCQDVAFAEPDEDSRR